MNLANITLSFKVHCPTKINNFTIFDIGKNTNYFQEDKIKEISKKIYDHANGLMLRLLNDNLNFRISYLISGITIDQLEKHKPETISALQKLADTGKVEFLSEPYYSPLSYFFSKSEFREQIKLHMNKINGLFGIKPKVFVTDLKLTNELVNIIKNLGFKAVLAKDNLNPQNSLYKIKNSEIKILLKNTLLSSYINHRFSDKNWGHWPLTVEKYADWINKEGHNSECINLFINYTALGLTNQKQTGILGFVAKLPEAILKNHANDFKTPSSLIKIHTPKSYFKIHKRSIPKISANKLQLDTLNKIYKIESDVKRKGNLIEIWRKLQAADNIASLSKNSVEESHYEKYISIMNILEDLNIRLNSKKLQQKAVIRPKIRMEKLNKDEIRRIRLEKPEEIIENLKEVYKLG